MTDEELLEKYHNIFISNKGISLEILQKNFSPQELIQLNKCARDYLNALVITTILEQ